MNLGITGISIGVGELGFELLEMTHEIGPTIFLYFLSGMRPGSYNGWL